MSNLLNNTTSLQEILETINNLPDANNGVELPELSNEGTSTDLLSGKELIDSEGNVVTGTFTIDSELTTQDNLIAQIQTALENKASGAPADPTLQEKTVSPSTSVQTVTPDSGYDGLSKVTINAMTTATQAIPSISVSSSGLITASATQTAGYVAAGTKSATKQLTTQAAKTVTPNTTTQTAVNSGVYTTGAIKVNPIPSSYIVPSGTKTITTNGTHDVKSYASATVNVASTGEDVTSETNAYTAKLTTLETAITALETELQGKASGGSSLNSTQWIQLSSLPTSPQTRIAGAPTPTYYYEVPDNCIAILIRYANVDVGADNGWTLCYKDESNDFIPLFGMPNVSIAPDNNFISITVASTSTSEDIYLMPIFSTSI